MSRQVEQNIAATKAKYPDNPWWDSQDPRVRAYWQLHEDILVLDWSQFADDVEVLLGRSVWTHEYGLRADALRAEAARAFSGRQDPEAERVTSIVDGMQALADTGKPIVVVEVDE